MNLLEIGESLNGNEIDTLRLFQRAREVLSLIGGPDELNNTKAFDFYILNDSQIVPPRDDGMFHSDPYIESGFNRITGAGGKATSSYGFMEVEIDTGWFDYYARHELAHIFDPTNYLGTRAQMEGFAAMVEVGCSYEASKKLLRTIAGYTNMVTHESLLKMIGPVDNQPHLTEPELYNVTGSFFTFLYEKLGKNAFLTFYNLITGNKYLENNRLLDTSGDDIKRFEGIPRSNPIEALSFAIENAYLRLDTDQLIGEYINDINR